MSVQSNSKKPQAGAARTLSEQEFLRTVKSGELSGIYFLCGEEDYLKNYYAARCADILFGDDGDAHSMGYFPFVCGDGELPVAEIENALSTPPLFTPQKLVSVFFSSLDSLDRRENASARDAFLSLLGRYKDSPDTIVVINASGGGFTVEKRKNTPSPLMKAFSAIASVVRIDYKNVSELSKWLAKHASAAGASISPDTARFLISYSSPSMYILSGEIEKLSAYALSRGRQEITVNDVLDCTPHIDEDIGYMLTNSISNGNISEAFHALGVEMRRKEDPYFLLAQISSAVCDISAARAALDDGVKDYEFAASAKLAQYRASKLYEAAAKLGKNGVGKAILLCAEAERNMKSSAAGTGRGAYFEIEKLLGAMAVKPEEDNEKEDSEKEDSSPA